MFRKLLNFNGITLIELMVVLLIFSILAAVSVPIYTSYLVKSRFTEVFTTINSYKSDLAVAYIDNDQFPSSYGDLTAANFSTISSAVLKLVYYNRSTDDQAAYLSFFTYDLGIEGYVEPDNSGAGGELCRITIAAVATGAGHIQFYCGQWDGSEEDVPVDYLPANCQDTNISALIS